jgi:nitrate reductase gamma subunit
LESIGLGLGLLALFGSVMLLMRRVNSGILKRVTFASDWVLLYLLIMQAATGVYIATFMRWGSVWYLHTAVPYFYSLVSLQPELGYVAEFPLIFKLHTAGAFLIVALLPFTKLVHLLFSPVAFLKDAPILYRWRSARGSVGRNT